MAMTKERASKALQGDGEWVGVAEAGRRLGLSNQAIRYRVTKNLIKFRTDNRGFTQVLVEAGTKPATHPLKGIPRLPSFPPEAPRPDPALQDTLTIILAQHKAHTEQLVEAYRAQVAAAEARAIRAEKTAVDALTAAADATERIAKQLIQGPSVPFWRRLFG